MPAAAIAAHHPIAELLATAVEMAVVGPLQNKTAVNIGIRFESVPLSISSYATSCYKSQGGYSKIIGFSAGCSQNGVFSQWATFTGTTMAESSGVIGRALVWAFAISFLVFFLFGSVFVGNLGPIPALIYSPIAFVASFIVFWIVEALLEPHTASVRKITYFALSLILLAPLVTYMAFNYREFTRAGSMEHAPPLTDEESLLLESTRLNLRIAVENPRRPPVYTEKLINDLRETCLFIEVGDVDSLDRADVLATITGAYWDDKTGFKFIFHLPENLTDGVEVEVSYKLRSSMTDDGRGGRADRKQYIDRLAVELIKASQVLFENTL